MKVQQYKKTYRRALFAPSESSVFENINRNIASGYLEKTETKRRNRSGQIFL